MPKNKYKVSDLMKEFGVSQKEALLELNEIGIDVKSIKNIIHEDFTEMVREHFQDFVDQKIAAKSQARKVAETRATASEVHLKTPIIVKTLADALKKKPNEIVSSLMSMNILASINQQIEPGAASRVCDKFGFKLVLDKREKIEHSAEPQESIEAPEEIPFKDDPEDLIPKPPVVTFLGHVDHGKTSLQDKVRKTNIVAGESGGITQHIGASTVRYKGKAITFIDTPGHAAFTAMRARGANITDIAILVVAADDGFMPQTLEALSHAKAAKVPVIVAINKMDLPNANPDRILTQMQQNNLMSEDWGGEVGVCRVSAETGEGIESLLERILLEAEMLEHKVNPKRPAQAVVLEAQVEQGLGSTANIIILNGTLKKGDNILCGELFGKIRSIFDETGNQIDEAGPSMSVVITGLSGTPEAGTKLAVCNDLNVRKIAEQRAVEQKNSGLERKSITLDNLFASIEKGRRKNLTVIIKADVKGSVEAIIDSLNKFPSDKISISTIHSGVGAITENDVLLAAASGAILIGFHVKVNTGVNELAKNEKVEIRLYSVIYELIEDIEEALLGRLAPEEREKEAGWARILEIFETSKGPNVIGCIVESGSVKVGAKARVFRDNNLIFNGSVKSLRRFKDDVKEVKAGIECGIRLDNFADFLPGDKVQLYEVEYKKASL
ncbi:MAG: translation initiation factor IF-2 [Victivallales bacterium]|nr:translation initiation factor IF-2 [Victivallales bacterium]